jgi:hypothetical protein
LPLKRQFIAHSSKRKGTPPHAAGSLCEAPGSVRRQKKCKEKAAKSLYYVSLGKNRKGRVNWLGLVSFNNFVGF